MVSICVVLCLAKPHPLLRKGAQFLKIAVAPIGTDRIENLYYWTLIIRHEYGDALNSSEILSRIVSAITGRKYCIVGIKIPSYAILWEPDYNYGGRNSRDKELVVLEVTGVAAVDAEEARRKCCWVRRRKKSSSELQLVADGEGSPGRRTLPWPRRAGGEGSPVSSTSPEKAEWRG
ncbi:DNA-binding family protein [Striga asiatica]|uniref:DNA-binding family protein n=1 Tax=Striga asiatica TaxID=4170 RepID=A0A5A7PAP7_STRAF|nr:DNA-binding family protein [Striga asiatica]